MIENVYIMFVIIGLFLSVIVIGAVLLCGFMSVFGNNLVDGKKNDDNQEK